jgi:hypothetical protein
MVRILCGSPFVGATTFDHLLWHGGWGYRIIAPRDRALLHQIGTHVAAWQETPEASIQATSLGGAPLRDPDKNTAYRTKLWAKRRVRAIQHIRAAARL